MDCVDCGSDRIENKDLMLCASCSAARRKADRMKPKVIVPMKKVSQKRALQTGEYLKIRKYYLEAYPCCEIEDCNRPSKDIHHQAGREGDKLTDIKYFLAVCRPCHEMITKDSAWAIANGYSILRTLSDSNKL